MFAKPKNIGCTILCFVFFAITSRLSYADSVHLNNGDIMTGSIVSYADNICVFNSQYGATVYFSTLDIKQMSTNGIFDIVLKSGETVKGKLESNGGNNSFIYSETLGKISISTQSILKMTAVFEKPKSQDNQPQAQDDKNLKKQEYGQSIDKEPPLDFLTGTAVLLRPGIFEIDVDLNSLLSG